MNKIDMMSVWQGIEYKLVKQQEAHMKATGMRDYEIDEKMAAINEKIIALECERYQTRKIIDRAVMKDNLAKYGITI